MLQMSLRHQFNYYAAGTTVKFEAYVYLNHVVKVFMWRTLLESLKPPVKIIMQQYKQMLTQEN